MKSLHCCFPLQELSWYVPPMQLQNPTLRSPKSRRCLAEMGAAANARDVERHVGFYAHDDWVVFIFNGEPTIGWQAIRDKQREVWRNGASDVVYTMQGKPIFLVAARGVVVTTIFLKSRRTMPNGQVADGKFAISSYGRNDRKAGA